MSDATGRQAERGQAIVFATLSLLVVFGAMGLALDIGWAYFRREACKTAAQAAAGAAAVAASKASGFSSCIAGDTVAPCRTDWPCPGSPANPPGDSLERGCLYAKKNGFSNANPRQSVVMSAGTGTSPAPGTAPAYWISATVSERLPQLFSAVLGNKMATVSVRAVSGVFLQPQGSCIYALSPDASPAINTVGTAEVHASCGVYDNSNASDALEVDGNGKLTTTGARIVGGYNTNGSGNLIVNPPSNLVTHAAPTPDPFASAPTPAYDPGRCDSYDISGSAVITMPSDNMYVICGNIGFTGNPTVNFPPGLYIVEGSVIWNNGNITGAGVTFFLAGANSSVQINGNINATLSAPAKGPYHGLLFYQNRNNLTPPPSQFDGGTDLRLDGSLYFPHANVTYTGGADVGAGGAVTTYTGLVADTISFKGTSYFGADVNGQFTGLGLPLIGIMQ